MESFAAFCEKLCVLFAINFVTAKKTQSFSQRAAKLSRFNDGICCPFIFKLPRSPNGEGICEVSAIDKLCLVFTLLLSFIFLREPLNPKLLEEIEFMVAGKLIIISN